ncbi:class I SAM-dependent methyltransferase [Pseudohoeflea suaedae]|uniref:Class I SAM-dependent methyltransferase n=1 Tax=Pseudohoeflea suaedae TaxID=877384 RepID=A0A4R5PNY3_9HYPH|nr:class I SAM-dependent methyltransferase [Pseudohoeflea suaedae]TDH38772.1 class I SAM-dependent methyltransferase [Pseudohoeflea suaedae]
MGRWQRQILDWLKVAVSQGLMIALLIGAARLSIVPSGNVAAIVAAQAIGAAAIGLLLRLRLIWLPVQLLLPVGLVYGGAAPAWIYLLAFAAIALVSWNAPSEQVPLYLTNRKTREALARLVTESGASSFVDLGCGTGSVLASLKRSHPRLAVAGVETAPLVFALAWLRLLPLRGRGVASVAYRSLWKEDLSRYDIVYCFLSPAPMAKLHAKATSEMKPGALFVSNSFKVPDVEPERTIELGDGRQTGLHLYRPGGV